MNVRESTPSDVSAVVVRRAVESDAGELLQLRKGVFAETEYMLLEPVEFSDTEEDERRRIAHLNREPNSACFVAVVDGTIVGFLSAMGGQVNRLRHSVKLALGVRRSCWGRGAGKALLDAALAWSRDAGLRRVELTVHITNERAVSLYKSAGFEIEGVRRSSLRVAGRYVDEYSMAVIHDDA